MLLKETAKTTPAPDTNFGLTMEEHLMPSVERMRLLRESIFQGLRVAAPAVVTAFDPETVTVSVVIAITERVLTSKDPRFLNPTTEAVKLPLLEDVPIVVMGAGGWSMTFPIKPGDECLLVFMDTALDSWFQLGAELDETGGVKAQNQISQRRHSLSDAIAIFGLRSTPRALPDYSTEAVQFRNDDGSVRVNLFDQGNLSLEAGGSSIEMRTDGSIYLTAETGDVVVENSLLVKNGATGSFTSSDGQVVTVVEGVIIQIT